MDDKNLLVVSGGNVIINPEFADKISQTTMDKLNWSGTQRINEVARLSMEMRDREILHRILKAYNYGKSPLVVYGGSHMVTLKPALEAYI